MGLRGLTSAIVLLLFLFTSATLPAASADATVRLSVTETGHILVPVMVNGSGPHLFILDTGANRSLISDVLAARLSLDPVATTEMVTSHGSAPAPVVRLRSLAIGVHHTADVLTPVVPLERLHGVHATAEGIIGQDVLIDAHYILDYRRSRLVWLAADTDSGSGTRLALRRSEGRLLVELPQSSRQERHALFVPDSGASTLVLFQRGGRAVIDATPLGISKLVTVTGDGDVQAAIVPKLRIGTGTLWDQSALLVAGPATDPTGADLVDGLLPLSRFSSVTFNGPAHYLVIR